MTWMAAGIVPGKDMIHRTPQECFAALTANRLAVERAASEAATAAAAKEASAEADWNEEDDILPPAVQDQPPPRQALASALPLKPNKAGKAGKPNKAAAAGKASAAAKVK